MKFFGLIRIIFFGDHQIVALNEITSPFELIKTVEADLLLSTIAFNMLFFLTRTLRF